VALFRFQVLSVINSWASTFQVNKCLLRPLVAKSAACLKQWPAELLKQVPLLMAGTNPRAYFEEPASPAMPLLWQRIVMSGWEVNSTEQLKAIPLSPM
jgi:hypothetical protein